MAEEAERPPDIVFVPSPARTEYVTRTVNVHEHRAPTDESVKLLREMEAKAEAEVLKAVSVESNGFTCVVHQSLDVMSDKVRWRAIFKLNGKPMTANTESDPRHERHMQDRLDQFAKLRDEMAKVIATEVLSDAFVALMRERFK